MKKMHTPGPWNWFERADGTIYLATPDRGHLCVLDAGSTDIGGSQPRLAVWDGEQRGRQGGVMRIFIEAGGPFHPDACLIGAAPLLLAALTKAVEETEKMHFEAWMVRVCPSGDVESVQRQWLDSSDHRDFVDEWREQIDAIAKATGERT